MKQPFYQKDTSYTPDEITDDLYKMLKDNFNISVFNRDPSIMMDLANLPELDHEKLIELHEKFLSTEKSFSEQLSGRSGQEEHKDLLIDPQEVHLHFMVVRAAVALSQATQIPVRELLCRMIIEEQEVVKSGYIVAPSYKCTVTPISFTKHQRGLSYGTMENDTVNFEELTERVGVINQGRGNNPLIEVRKKEGELKIKFIDSEAISALYLGNAEQYGQKPPANPILSGATQVAKAEKGCVIS